MEITSSPTKAEQGTRASGFLEELAWLLAGAVLPLASLAFYRKASQRRVAAALLFFLLFTSTISLLTTVGVGVAMSGVMDGIQRAYEEGAVPEIVIENGITRVDAPQPFILLNQQQQSESVLVAIDTTGQIQEIDRTRYSQGFLLTRTELHILNNGEYQVAPLRDIHVMLERDPILINAGPVSQAWAWISIIIVIATLIFLIVWHFFVRLMFLAMISLLVWGFVSLIRPNTGFGPVIISGLYASVPAIYLSHLFSRSGFSFLGLQILFLIVFWSIGLIASLAGGTFLSRERPLRLWTALLGLPMLVLYIVDLFLQFEPPYGPVALWGVTLVTILGIAGLRIYYRWKEKPEGGPAPT